jgi:molybdate transport system substrate-binding protein
MERRAFLRWLAIIGAGGIDLTVGPAASWAQHHQPAVPPVPGDGAATLVFAAATLKPALDDVLRAFAAAGGTAVNVAYGPGPILARNIEDGAPADIFFSADALWMDYLAERKLIRADTRAAIVRNEIVLVQGENGASGEAIAIDASFPIAGIVGAGPIAMCNPQSHPAGRYGRLRLQEQHLWDGHCVRHRHPRHQGRAHRRHISRSGAIADRVSRCPDRRRAACRAGLASPGVPALPAGTKDFRRLWVPVVIA